MTQDVSSPSQPERALRKVLVVYNCDYDPTPAPRGVHRRDRSDVARAAHEVRDAIKRFGLEPEILGVIGPELGSVIDKVRRQAPDLVFNLIESLAQNSNNEIVIPAVFDMLSLPYTGSPPLALGLALHKPKTKDILRSRGVPTPASCTVENTKDAAGVDLPFPLFVKLAQEDASVGILDENVVMNRRALVRRVRDLIDEFRQPVLIERYVEGREVYVTILGNDPPVALPFHEIDFSRLPSGRPRIVNFAAKWDPESPEYHGTTPVMVGEISELLRASLERTAIAAFRALGLRDYGRVDFRVADDGTPFVIDVNPNCDISPDAGVARAARAAGLDYPALIGRICQIAYARFHDASSKARAA